MPIKKNKSHKFPLPEKTFGKAIEQEWIKINRISLKDTKKINDGIIEIVLDYVPAKNNDGTINNNVPPFAVEREKCLDEVERDKRQWECMISDWCLYNEEGEKIGTDRDTIYNTLMEYPELLTFVSDCMKIMTESSRKEKDDLEKN